MPTRARFLTLAVLTVAVALASFGAATASADTGDIGFTDHVYTPLGNSATASKPESKLWYAGGAWWSTMFSPSANRWRIYKLNAAGSTWTDTGVNADDRRSTRADTLFDPATNKLFLASHVFEASTNKTATAANSGRVYRYSFNGTTWSLDAGFPVTINAASTETLVIDKDSTGVVWATWALGNRIYVNHSTAGSNGGTWGTPYIVPATAAQQGVSADDISSVIHYGGNKIGVMWGNQNTGQWLFATHTDGTGDAAANWSTAVVPTGFSPDDHINLKAGDDGRVYAALKTSESTSANPLVQLAVRNTNGTWSVSTYGTKANRLTRPIVELDEEANVVHMFVTCPGNNDTNGENGGDICTKSTPMSSLSFAPGAGTPIIRDFSLAEMNDASSTKQNVNSSMGLYVMANNPDTDTYWHSANVLGGAPPPAGVSANFSGTPTSGSAPLNVQFTDTSTGGPTTWNWNFGDAGSGAANASTEQNPSHQYTSPGTYTVTLTANKPGGTASTSTKTNYITVNPPPSNIDANFTGTPTSGDAPLDVQFTDTSTGSPTSWSWEFGDGGTSTEPNPSHTYTAPGTYTVKLTANDGGTPNTETKTSYITVNAPPGSTTTTTLNPVADAQIKSTSPTTNYGTLTQLQLRGDVPSGVNYRTLLRFTVSGTSGPITDAKLRLFVTDASPDGGSVYLVDNGWLESTVNWNNAPSVAGLTPVASFGATPAVGSYAEVDLGDAITANGTYAFVVVSASTNSAIYASREAAQKPQLVLTSGGGGGGGPTPVSANFSGTPTSGTAPLSVVFSDSSTGNPTSWSWSFGDGATSNLQNPEHTYTTPGTYNVSLTVSKAGVADSAKTLNGYITVNPTGGGGGGGAQQIFTAAADAIVKQASPTKNYGTLTTLQVRTDGTNDYRSLLRFTVSGLTGPVATAKLRLFVTDPSPDGGRVYGADNGWSETGVTWSTMPSIAGLSPISIGTTPAAGGWVEVDVTSLITGNGTFGLVLASASSNSAIYASREAAQKPELVITTT